MRDCIPLIDYVVVIGYFINWYYPLLPFMYTHCSCFKRPCTHSDACYTVKTRVNWQYLPCKTDCFMDLRMTSETEDKSLKGYWFWVIMVQCDRYWLPVMVLGHNRLETAISRKTHRVWPWNNWFMPCIWKHHTGRLVIMDHCVVIVSRLWMSIPFQCRYISSNTFKGSSKSNTLKRIWNRL